MKAAGHRGVSPIYLMGIRVVIGLPGPGALAQRPVNGDFMAVGDAGARSGIGCGAGA